MSDAVVIPMSSGEFVLQIQLPNHSVEHRIDIPRRVLDDLGLPHDRAKEVISRSVEWLRENSGSELPPRVDLGECWDRDADFRRHLESTVGA